MDCGYSYRLVFGRLLVVFWLALLVYWLFMGCLSLVVCGYWWVVDWLGWWWLCLLSLVALLVSSLCFEVIWVVCLL